MISVVRVVQIRPRGVQKKVDLGEVGIEVESRYQYRFFGTGGI